MASLCGRLCFGRKTGTEEVELITNTDENPEEKRFATMMKKMNVGEIEINKEDKFLDMYEIGQLIGQGTLGEVRVC
jgi:hypothetical protein